MFKAAARRFSAACDRQVEKPGSAWPKSLRVRDVEGAAGVMEMTWSFSGPDGRATWEWGSHDAHPADKAAKVPMVVWRRVGNHGVFRDP